METRRYNPQEFNPKAMQDLMTAVVEAMVNAFSGKDDTKLKWDQAIFGAAMAIRAVAGLAGEIEQLDDDEVKETSIRAVMEGLTVPIQAVRVDTMEQFEEMSAAMEQAPEGPRH